MSPHTHLDATDSPQANPLHVVIIGGGLSGLAAAFYLQQGAQASGRTLRYTLVERDTRLGGKILTDRLGQDGAFVVEGGPDSFVTQKPWGLELARELGLEDQLMGTAHVRCATYVLINGHPTPMPEGMVLIAPTRWGPFIRSPLFSPWGKLRMALETLVPPRRDPADETLADFVRRRFGREALDRIGEPLLAGIHSNEAERQSMTATFPRFQALEQQHGSVIRGLRAARRAAHRQAGTARSSIPTSPFITLRNGIGTLVEALEQRLHGRIMLGCRVSALIHQPNEPQPYAVQLEDGAVLPADAVILTVPAFTAAELVAPFQAELASRLRQIRYASTGTITLAYRRSEIVLPLDGFGLVIPRSEQRQINACTMSSIKFAHRAPEDYLLVRVFVGGTHHPEALELDDAALLAMVQAELAALLHISATPYFSRIYRWQQANPQYDLGHLERVATLGPLCPPGLYLSGSAYRGVGIPDCVRQAREAAEQALADLQRPRHPEHQHSMANVRIAFKDIKSW